MVIHLPCGNEDLSPRRQFSLYPSKVAPKGFSLPFVIPDECHHNQYHSFKSFRTEERPSTGATPQWNRNAEPFVQSVFILFPVRMPNRRRIDFSPTPHPLHPISYYLRDKGDSGGYLAVQTSSNGPYLSHLLRQKVIGET